MSNVTLNVILGAVNNMRPGLTSAEAGLKGLRAQSEQVAKDFKASWGEVSQLSQKVGAGMMAGGAAFVGSMVAAAKSVGDLGHELEIASGKTGVGVTALSELKYAAEVTGGSLDTVVMALRFVEIAADKAKDATSPMGKDFTRLGVSIRDGNGNLKQGEALLMETADALSKVTDATERARIARDLYGRGGIAMLPMIMAGIGGLRETARQLGLSFSEEDIKRAADFAVQMRQLGVVTKTAFQRIGLDAIPTLENIIGTFIRGVGWVAKFTQEHPKLTNALVTSGFAMSGFMIASGAVLFVLPGLIKGIELLTSAQGKEALATLSQSASWKTLLGDLWPLVIALTLVGNAVGRFNEMGKQGVPIWDRLTQAVEEFVDPLNQVYVLLKTVAGLLGIDTSKWAKSFGVEDLLAKVGLTTPEKAAQDMRGGASAEAGVTPTGAAAPMTPAQQSDLERRLQEESVKIQGRILTEDELAAQVETYQKAQQSKVDSEIQAAVDGKDQATEYKKAMEESKKETAAAMAEQKKKDDADLKATRAGADNVTRQKRAYEDWMTRGAVSAEVRAQRAQEDFNLQQDRAQEDLTRSLAAAKNAVGDGSDAYAATVKTSGDKVAEAMTSAGGTINDALASAVAADKSSAARDTPMEAMRKRFEAWGMSGASVPAITTGAGFTNVPGNFGGIPAAANWHDALQSAWNVYDQPGMGAPPLRPTKTPGTYSVDDGRGGAHFLKLNEEQAYHLLHDQLQRQSGQGGGNTHITINAPNATARDVAVEVGKVLDDRGIRGGAQAKAQARREFRRNADGYGMTPNWQG